MAHMQRPRTTSSTTAADVVKAELAPPLSGPEALPSERAQARRLQEALVLAFGRSPAGTGPPTLPNLLDEWSLISRCTAQLVKLLATRCLEWGQVLELIRQRLEHLWQHAGELLRGSSHRAWDERSTDEAGSATNSAMEAMLQAQVEQLRSRLEAAEERADAAEKSLDASEQRLNELAPLPAQVAMQASELRACRALIDELSSRQSERAAEASRPAVPVLVLLPDGADAGIPERQAQQICAPAHGRRTPSDRATSDRASERTMSENATPEMPVPHPSLTSGQRTLSGAFDTLKPAIVTDTASATLALATAQAAVEPSTALAPAGPSTTLSTAVKPSLPRPGVDLLADVSDDGHARLPPPSEHLALVELEALGSEGVRVHCYPVDALAARSKLFDQPNSNVTSVRVSLTFTERPAGKTKVEADAEELAALSSQLAGMLSQDVDASVGEPLAALRAGGVKGLSEPPLTQSRPTGTQHHKGGMVTDETSTVVVRCAIDF